MVFSSYKRTFIFTSVVAAFVSISINLGLLDRPDFIYHESLWSNSRKDDINGDDDSSSRRPMFAILATIKTKNIGGNIGWMIETTKSSLLKDDSDNKASTLMRQAASAYGAPDGAEELNVGLYFDDPCTVDEPRWGIGWALAVTKYKELEVWKQKVAKEFAEKQIGDPTAGKVVIRAVRIGPGPVLKAKIPWRNRFTPMIQPMLQWRRGFQTFEDGRKQGLYDDASNNRHTVGDYDPVALEVYVTGPNDSMEFIDYVVLLGDTSTVWDDAFPQPEGDNNFTDEEVKIE
jgi:hypothetical protein